MKRRGLLVAAGLLIAGALSLFLPPVQRPLAALILESGPGSARPWALERLADEAGGEARLLDALSGEDPALADRAEALLEARGLAAAPSLALRLDQARCRALLEKLGAAAAPALVEAIALAADGSRGDLVAMLAGLEDRGEASVLAAIDRGRDQLRTGLKDSDKASRSRLALIILRSVERAPGASAALTFRSQASLEPFLIEALLAKEAKTRAAAALQLDRISTPASLRLGFVKPGAAVPLLVEAHRDPAAGVRATAAQLLERLTPRSLALVPYFVQGLSDRNPNVRLAVARALVSLGPAANFPAPRLVEVLLSFEGERGEEGLALIGRLGAKGKSALPKLRALLSDPKPARRIAALKTLGRLGTNAGSEVNAVFARLDDPDPAVREAAAAAAPLLLPSGAEIASLITALRRRPDRITAAMARALGNFGKRAAGAVDLLIARYPEAPPPLKASLIEALVSIGRGDPGPLEEPLLRAMADGGAPRRAALRGLTRLNLTSPALVAALDRFSHGADAEARGLAIDALARRAKNSAAARAALVRAAESDATRKEAWTALKGTAASAETAALLRRALARRGGRDAALTLLAFEPAGAAPHQAALVSLVEDSAAADATRAKAIAVLGRLGAASAVPALIRILEGRDREHRGLSRAIASGAIAAETPAMVGALRARRRLVAEAIRALGRIGKAAEAAAEPLAAFLKTRDDPAPLTAALKERGAADGVLRAASRALIKERVFLDALAKESLVLVGKGESLRTQ